MEDIIDRERGSGYTDGKRDSQCNSDSVLTGPYEGNREVGGDDRVTSRERW